MLRFKIIKKFFLFTISLAVYYLFNSETPINLHGNLFRQVPSELRDLLEKGELNSISDIKYINAKLAKLATIQQSNVTLSDYGLTDLSLSNKEMANKWNRYIRTEPTFSVPEFQPYLKPKDKEILYAILEKLHEICVSLQFTCFMYSGTLLGSWRHHDIIPWDGDADIMANSTEKDELFSALSIHSPQYDVYNSGTRFKFYSSKGIKTTEYPWTWPYVDIFFFRENETHIYDEIPTRAFLRDYVYPKKVIFPLHLRPFGKISFEAPRDSFAALEITYKTTNCETHFYNHKEEKVQREKFKEVPCVIFRNDIGFVFRVRHELGLMEFLIKGSTIIHSILVNEPSYAVSHPFNLTLM